MFRTVLTNHIIIIHYPYLNELDDGKIYRKALYLMVKSMVSCKFSFKPIHWISTWCSSCSSAAGAWWCHKSQFHFRQTAGSVGECCGPKNTTGRLGKWERTMDVWPGWGILMFLLFWIAKKIKDPISAQKLHWHCSLPAKWLVYWKPLASFQKWMALFFSRKTSVDTSHELPWLWLWQPEELALKFLDAVDALGLPKFPSYGAAWWQMAAKGGVLGNSWIGHHQRNIS